MYVIVLASQKGGAGKTTLAAHLAVAAEAAGDGPAVLIDTDPQGSLSAWWNVRKAEVPKLAPMTIAELPEKLELLGMGRLRRRGYRHAAGDHRGDRARCWCRPISCSFRPGRARTICAPSAAPSALVQGAGKPFVFAVTQAKPNTRLTVQAMAALSEHGKVAPSIVHDRVDYAGSMIDGRTVQEIDPRGRSAAEMAELWEFLKAQMAKSTKARKRAVA